MKFSVLELFEYVFIQFQMGAYHTLDLEVNRKFTVTKQWDSIDLERVESACDPAQVELDHVCITMSKIWKKSD